MRRQRQAGIAGVVFASLLMLILAAAPAQAATTTTHPYLFKIDGSTSPAGRFSGTVGIAIHHSSGTLYVLDVYSVGTPGDFYEQVPVYDADGNFLRQLELPAQADRMPSGIAVDNSGGVADGYVYLLDEGCRCNPGAGQAGRAGRIHVYDPLGNYVKTINGSQTDKGYLDRPRAIAVDNLGFIHVLTSGDNTIHKFSSNGFYASSFTYPSELGTVAPQALTFAPDGNLYVSIFRRETFETAVLDPSGSFLGYGDDRYVDFDPTTGDQYAVPLRRAFEHVAEADAYVVHRDSGGNLIGRFGSIALTGTRVRDGRAYFNPQNGRVYVLARRWTVGVLTAGEIHTFGPAESITAADVSIDPVISPSYFSAAVEGTVNPQGVPTTYYFEYRRADWEGGWRKTPTEDAGSGTDPVDVSAEFSGLLNDVDYEVRLVATNTTEDADVVSELQPFTTLAVPPPIAAILPATDITANSAKIEGTVDPEGFATDWSIEVGDQKVSGNFGDVDGPQPVSASITGLAPNTEYTATLTASNPGGTDTVTVKFKTNALPPEVVTRFAAPRTQTTARLNALINPRNSATTYWFEYGKTDQYGSRVPAVGGSSAGKGNSSVLVSEEISGLEPGTTYHFRVVATNGVKDGSGEVEVAGEDVTFTTRTSAESGPPDRGIELITNPDKGNQAPTIIDYAQQEDKAIWSVSGGAPGSPAGVRGPFLAERTEEGWKSASILPPIDKLFGGGVKYFDLLAVSPDLAQFVMQGREGIVSGSNLSVLRMDGTGSYQLLAELTNTRVNLPSSVSHTEALGKVFIPTAEPIDPEHGPNAAHLYDFTKAPPVLISRMPGTDVPPSCGIAAQETTVLPGNFGNGFHAWNSTRESGPVRVFFQTRTGDCETAPLQLYVRNLSQASTELISGPPHAGSLEPAYFVRANPAGDEVLFVTATKLDPDDSNTTRDIYKWTAGKGNECLTCVADESDIWMTANRLEVAAPDDLSRIYFMSNRNLVPGIEMGGVKLYVYRDGGIEFIAPVGGGEGILLKNGLSDDGTKLVFYAAASGITTDPIGSEPQLYQYDEAAGSVECVSCPKTSAPAAGVEVPYAVFTESPVATADGRSVVFQSPAKLIPGDINNSDDVYEWRDGKLRLVTDGETVFPSGSGRLFLHGISRNGANVYFAGGANLTGYEADSMPQAYAAHRGGGFPPPPVPPAPCDGDSCQGPLAPEPPLGSAASSTSVGPGDQGQRAKKKAKKKQKKSKGKAAKRCAKGKGKKAAKCKQKQKKKKRAAKGKGRAGR